MEDFVIEIPNKRSELEDQRRKLVEVKAPQQHVEYIDKLLADVDVGIAKCLPET